MAKQSLIKWTKEDERMLKQVISRFNKKVNRLEERLDDSSYIPDLVDYSETKKLITTRNELNRVLKSLQRFSTRGAEKKTTLQSGVEISTWEKKELQYLKANATRRINRRIKELEVPISGKYSRVSMGSEEFNKLKATLKSLSKIEKVKGQSFERLKARLENLGSSDYEMRKAIQYRENFYKMLENFKNLDNYEKLKKQLDKIQNPISFYEFVSQDERFADINFMYDSGMAEEMFDEFLESFEEGE